MLFLFFLLGESPNSLPSNHQNNMERYTERPRVQGERRTDNTPVPAKNQKSKEGAGVNAPSLHS